MAAVDYLTLRSTIVYTSPGVLAPTGSIFTVGSSGVQAPVSNMVVQTLSQADTGSNSILAFQNTVSKSIPFMLVASIPCVSATGQYIAFINAAQMIVVSSNYGTSFTTYSTDLNGPLSLGMSGDGAYLLCYSAKNIVGQGTFIRLYSSNNLGATWSTAASYPVGSYSSSASMCLSYNGTHQYVGFSYTSGNTQNYALLYSSNSGASFTTLSLPVNKQFSSLCCSANGTYVSIGVSDDSLYYSSNNGLTWTISSGAPSNGSWIGLACSNSGQYQMATTPFGNDRVYWSDNYGQTWNISNSPLSNGWWGITCSASGQYAIVANAATNSLYVSSDYGRTYIKWTSVPNIVYYNVKVSQGAQYIIATTNSSSDGGYLFTNSNLSAGGLVGIGTTTPSSIFDVNGSINSKGALTLSDAYPAANGLLRLLTSGGVNYVQSGLTLTSDSKADLVFGSMIAGSEWMRIKSTGNVGIGIAAPTAALHIKNTVSAMRITGNLTSTSLRPVVTTTPSACEIRGSSSSGDTADDGFLRLSAGGGNGPTTQTYIDLSGSSNITDMDKNIVLGTAGVERMRITYDGRVGIGTATPGTTYALHVVGNIFASQDITAFSDQRYKQNIVRLDRSLDTIRSISGYSYTREDYRPGERHIGLLAQEVLAVFPEAVSYDSANDKYSVNYNCLMAPVVEAIKELYDRSEAQDKIIQAQQSMIQKLLDHLGPQ